MAVLTISREYGAGGKTLGELVAKKIGYACINEQIIEMIAERAKVSKNWVESIEMEAGSTLLKVITSMIPKSYIERILGNSSGYIDENVYVEMLTDVITHLADEGNCVIIGRGGQYILKDRSDVRHIFLVAHKEYRYKFMENTYDLLPSQAKNIVDTMGKRRANLFRRFGMEEYNTPEHYNLILNMSRLSMDQAVAVVCEMFE